MKINKIRNSSYNFIKVFSLTSISTLIRILTGFLSVKFLSINLGPLGLALIGHFNNYSSIFMLIATGGITNGITKYIAEYGYTKKRKQLFIITSLCIVITLSLITSFILITFSKYFSRLIFNSNLYQNIIILFAITLVFNSLNSVFLSVLNGLKLFRNYFIVNVLVCIITLLSTVLFVEIWKIQGAFISIAILPCLIFPIMMMLKFNSSLLKSLFVKNRISTYIMKRYVSYAIMTLVASSIYPISQIIIRSRIIQKMSIYDAGIWEGLNRLSVVYLSVITTSLSVYYLPRLSELKSNIDLRTELVSAYKLIIPFLTFILFGLYIFKQQVVQLLFSNSFLEMSTLFKFQLIGDFFKIISWLIAYIMIAKSLTRIYVFTEILFSISYVLMSIFFFNQNGLLGLSFAYMLNYLFYFLYLLIFFKKKYGRGSITEIHKSTTVC